MGYHGGLAIFRGEPVNTDISPVVVVTGASSGIGLASARALAQKGWRVIAVGRDPARSAAAEKAIREVSATGRVDMLRADLSLLAEAERLAAEIAGLTDRVDVLLNNAGGMPSEKVITSEGLEQSFAANHLGPFVLTSHLLPLLRRAAAGVPRGGVRIINTSSNASEMVPTLNLDDMQNLENFSVGLAYCSGKLANVLFARALARRLEADGIVAHALHPGVVDSNFFASFSEENMAQVSRDEMVTPEEGADTLQSGLENWYEPQQN